MAAASNDYPECIPYLIEEAKMKRDDEFTALMLAAKEGPYFTLQLKNKIEYIVLEYSKNPKCYVNTVE